jgi:hypothetical protein
MLVLNGFIEAGQFKSETNISIPDSQKAILILDEKEGSTLKEKLSRQKNLWAEIRKEIEESDEVLEGEPERLHFRTPTEVDAL